MGFLATQWASSDDLSSRFLNFKRVYGRSSVSQKTAKLQGRVTNPPLLDYEPTFVARFWWEGGIGTPDNFQPLQDHATVHAFGQVDYSPARAYDRWRDQLRAELDAIAERDNFYVESFNEVGVSREYLQFERERTARLHGDYGLRSLVGNLGVGWSTLGHFELARDVGLIHTLRDHGGAWGEHGYGSVLGLQMYHGPQNQAVQADGRLGRTPIDMANDRTIYPDTVDSWLAMRASMSHQHLIKVGGGDIPIIISEFGFDDAGFHSYRHYTGGAAVSAWRECIPYWQQLGYLKDKSAAQFYGEQLAWSEAQSAIYPWLIGMTVFTVGSDPASRWALYDVLDTPVFDHFLAALNEQPSLPDDPPQIPPAPLPEMDGCFITPTSGRVNVRSQPTTDAPIVTVLEPGEAVEALAIYHEAPGRMWFRAVAGYIAGWTVTVNDHCETLPDETPPVQDDIPTQPMPVPEEDDRLAAFLTEFRDVLGEFSEWIDDLLDGEGSRVA
jgi:hypothetical protein